jgi:hydroxyacylglutathione hydrolase
MLFSKVVSEGLSHNSYLVGSGSAAAVIDPRRDASIYCEIAEQNNMRIRYVFETHKNEDYVIGSLELADLAGAEVYHGRRLDFGFGKPAEEGDRFRLGSLELEVLETPGHTEESISIVLRETGVSPDPLMVFTGDTLLAGDAGRTDFYGSDRREEMSTLLYESITERLLPLGDGVIVCPAHGAGSVCAAGIADLELTTIGYEKANNPLLQLPRSEFVRVKAEEHHYYPPYFKRMEDFNKNGPPLIHRLPEPQGLTPPELEAWMVAGAQLVDIRSPMAFAGGHIPGTLHIPRNLIPAYAGWLLDYQDPLILVDDDNCDLASVVRYFVRLGYDQVKGYLAGGCTQWFKSGRSPETITAWDAHALERDLARDDLVILDVRTIENREDLGYIPGSSHIYLGELPERIGEVPRDGEVVVYCDAGFKGSIGASILKKHGYRRVGNLLGGMTAWLNAGMRVEKG